MSIMRIERTIGAGILVKEGRKMAPLAAHPPWLGRPCGIGKTMPLDVEIIADQINRAFWGESWHGPSVREVLAGVSAEDAAAHPVAGAHRIWEIVLHLTGGYRLVLRRVGGERAQLSPEEEWPPVREFSFEAWRESQHTLGQLNQQLQSAVRAFPAERLSQELGSQYSAHIQFCGAPEHDLYHAGQIVILKKALSASRGVCWAFEWRYMCTE